MVKNNVIKSGDRVPEFTLSDQYKKNIRISDLKGKRILLSFHPLAWTAVCAKQMKSLEQNHTRFKELNTVPFGISVDSVPSKKAWADKELHITKTSLLADFWPHGGVAKLFGIFREKDGFSERANIIINEEQTVVFAKIYEISQLPDIEEIIKIIQQKGGSP